MIRETYQIDTFDQLGAHLQPIQLRTTVLGTFVDCLAGRTRVIVQMGVRLCSGCDCHVASDDAPCDCTRPAQDSLT